MGAFVGKLLPDWILVSSLVVLLGFTTQTTLQKGISQFKKETKFKEELAKSELSKALDKDQENSESQSLLTDDDGQDEGDEGSSSKDTNKKTRTVVAAVATEPTPIKVLTPEEEELATLRESERNTPFDKVQMLTIMVAVVIVLNLLKGGGGNFPNPLGITCGSFSYWLLTASVFVWVVGVSLYMRAQLITKWQLKTRLNYQYAEGDVEWNETNTLIYPCIVFFAGFTAGLFGIGGGIVKGPLMLQMGIHPLVASGTVAVMIMYTSVAATTMFMAFGTLTWYRDTVTNMYLMYSYLSALLTVDRVEDSLSFSSLTPPPYPYIHYTHYSHSYLLLPVTCDL